MNLLKPKEISCPKFFIPYKKRFSSQVVTIQEGTIKYKDGLNQSLTNINITIGPEEKVALLGKNGSGKSTLVKAILNHNKLEKTGQWYVPPTSAIGYLDQHYKNLSDHSSIYQTIKDQALQWTGW